MSEKIATNLVGRSAQITMGVEVNEQTRQVYLEGHRPCHHFGAKGEIVAVYKHEGELMATLQLRGFSDTKDGGKLVEVFVCHLRVITD